MRRNDLISGLQTREGEGDHERGRTEGNYGGGGGRGSRIGLN